MKAQRTARFLVVAAACFALAVCSSGGSGSGATASPTTRPGAASGASAGAASIGSGPRQVHPGVAAVCRTLAAAPPGPPTDVGARLATVTSAQQAVRAVSDRTAADDQVLGYLDAQHTWLVALQTGGLGHAGPPPAPPPAFATCVVAARATP